MCPHAMKNIKASDTEHSWHLTSYTQMPSEALQKSCIRETPNLSTDADRSTSIFIQSIRNNSSILRLYEFVHKYTSPTPPKCGPSMGAILNNSLF